MHRGRWQLWAGLLLVCGGILLILIAWPGAERALIVEQPPTSRSTPTPEPLIPTRTPTESVPRDVPVGMATSTEAAVTVPTLTASSTLYTQTPSPTAVEPPQAAPTPQGSQVGGALWMERPRWGVGVANGPISRYDVELLHLGWYLDWGAQASPPRPGGIVYAQMIRLSGGVLRPDAGTIAAVAQANPGSLWLVGNEPDVMWQDNVTPVLYAQLYHEAYVAVKSVDPTAHVAVGGVSQPTPLRLRYLDAVLGAYQEQYGANMPVDTWNVHNFILQELRGSWGVDIPPGIADDQGMLYEVSDSDDLEVFRQQIVSFRRWMAQHGYQDRPLIVSEYGILMPEDFGFPPERVAAFLTGTFDFFLTATDPTLGYPTDGYRLVQLWCWYSLDDSADHYPTGNLFDPETGAMTAMGEAWSGYVARYVE